MGVLLNALHLLHETAYKIVIDTEGSMIGLLYIVWIVHLSNKSRKE